MSKIKEREALVKHLEESYDQIDRIFVSYGKKNERVHVQMLKYNDNLLSQLNDIEERFKAEYGRPIGWMKIDVVTQVKAMQFDELKLAMKHLIRNYIPFGISFDERFEYAFISEEITSNAFVTWTSDDRQALQLNERNINDYIVQRKPYLNQLDLTEYKGQSVLMFETEGFYYDHDKVYELSKEYLTKGMRLITGQDEQNDEFNNIVQSLVKFLKNEQRPNGQFTYGYFPHFDEEIDHYNTLRHLSSTYTLLKGLNYTDQNTSKVKKSIDYITKNFIHIDGDEMYVFDTTNDINEIKFGQNAMFILAATEYLSIDEDDELRDIVYGVAEGMKAMLNLNSMDSIDVLNYPDLTIKESERSIQYEGMAMLSFMKVYALEEDEEWLDIVYDLLGKFVDEQYSQYHDHWIILGLLELIRYDPTTMSVQCVMSSIKHTMDNIESYTPSYAPILEMLVAGYEVTTIALDEGIDCNIDQSRLLESIQHRANIQRAAFFYPELAMYFKNPKRIVGSFFVKEAGYRVRIDDIEHALNGYMMYLQLIDDL